MITLESVNKSYKTGKICNKVLTDVNLQISGSKIICISGPSGAGKSTILNILAGLDAPDSGEVKYNDANIYKYSEKEMEQYRRTVIGFVFQEYHLIPNLTTYENIMLSAELVKNPLSIEEILGFVGLSDVFCKPFLDKVAKYFWTLLHVQIGQSCKALASLGQTSRLALQTL